MKFSSNATVVPAYPETHGSWNRTEHQAPHTQFFFPTPSCTTACLFHMNYTCTTHCGRRSLRFDCATAKPAQFLCTSSGFHRRSPWILLNSAYCSFLIVMRTLTSSLKGGLHCFSSAYLNCRHQCYYALGPFQRKVKVPWTQIQLYWWQ